MARASLKGITLSPGIAVGKLRLMPDARIYEKRTISEENIGAEVEALKQASIASCARLKRTISSIPENLSEYREIVALQMELARDQRILNGAIARIRHKKICASWALSETISELAVLFQSMADPYLSERAQDIRHIGQCLLDALAGGGPAVNSDEPCILAAYDLSPANIMELAPNNVLGLITAEGGVTSHTAILARGLKTPAIGALGELFRVARNGETVILDGLAGEAIIGPDQNEIAHYKDLRKIYSDFETEARQAALQPAATTDGLQMTVLANLENVHELHELKRCGAEGIGLFRTEFSWLREAGQDESALFREYDAILLGANDKKVVFRTLDVGADKALPAQEALHEPNPALGLRGIRFCLNRKDLFRPQIRALLRAGARGNMAIMLPMITTINEVREFRSLVKEVGAELHMASIPHNPEPPIGVMVETPAAVLICAELARECDFISLGTNDLLHYMMAIDRNNRHVSYLHDPLHPAFMRAIRQVAEVCRDAGKKVSVCGELAADPVGLILLVGLGIDVFSATPRFVPAIKHILRKLNAAQCRQIATKALNADDPGEIRAGIRAILTECMGRDALVQNRVIGADG